MPDGCGGVVECGGCSNGQTCGAGAIPNTCALGSCKAKTCEEVGLSCGWVSDGCGAVLLCGECATPLVCGAGGIPNRCGSPLCEPACPSGATCQNGVCYGADQTQLNYDFGSSVHLVVNPVDASASLCTNGTVEVTFYESQTTVETTVVVPCASAAGAKPSAPVVLAQGKYDVSVSQYQVMTGIGITSDITLTVPFTPVSVSGTVSYAGAPLSAQCPKTPVLVISGTATQTKVQLPLDCATGAFSGMLPPGAYSATLNGSNDPYNLLAAFTVSGATTGLTLTLDGALVSGVIKKNGATLDGACAANIMFHSDVPANRYIGPFPVTCSGGTWQYSLVVPKGRYRPGIHTTSANSPLPAYGGWVSPTVLEIDGSNQTYDLDIPVTQIQGTFTVPGAAVNGVGPSVRFKNGNQNVIAPRFRVITTALPWTYSGLIYSGTYTKLSVDGYGTTLFPPAEVDAKDINETITGATRTLNLSVTPIQITGRILNNGKAMGYPCSGTKPELVCTRGKPTLECSTAQWSYSGLFYPGENSVELTLKDPVPPRRNGTAWNTVHTLTTPAMQDLNFTPALIQGHVLRNGQNPAVGGYAYVRFVDPDGDEKTAYISSGADGWFFEADVRPGVPYVPKLIVAEGNTMPRMFDFTPENLVVIGNKNATTSFTLDVPVVPVSGFITLNGQLPATLCKDRSTYISFGNVKDRSYTQAPIQCEEGNWSYGTSLVPGIYQVALIGDGISAPKGLILNRRLDIR